MKYDIFLKLKINFLHIFLGVRGIRVVEFPRALHQTPELQTEDQQRRQIVAVPKRRQLENEFVLKVVEKNLTIVFKLSIYISTLIISF